MRVESSIVSLDAAPGALRERIGEVLTAHAPVIRWGLVGAEGGRFHLEIASLCGAPQARRLPGLVPEPSLAVEAPQRSRVVFVVPTGVGASIGGFIGDAGAIVRAIGELVDDLIVHPNVANAGAFYAASDRALYIDGLTLDRFLEGEGQLDTRPIRRIGVLVDRISSAEETSLQNTLNALRVVEGAPIAGYVKCAGKVKASVSPSPFGHFTGTVEDIDELLARADELKQGGADAIAVVTDIDGFTPDDVRKHYCGEAVNPVGAIEALISRAITWHTGLPCAHAPLYSHGLGETGYVVDRRAAAEAASQSGVPCLIRGLARSRRLTTAGGLSASSLSAVVIPASCAGGVPAFAASRQGIPVVAVRRNRCLVGVEVDRLALPHVNIVDNYADALAFLCCLKAQVDWDAFNGRHPSFGSVNGATERIG